VNNKSIDRGMDVIQAGSDLSQLAQETGVPGVGLLGRFAQHFYQRHLQKRFEKFASDAAVDESMIEKIVSDENYSNFFYATLETVRQTHSKIGLVALALIYKDHWNDENYLMAATRAFSQVSDKTLNAFISLYDSIPDDSGTLELRVKANGDNYVFHDLYNEAVELIARNFFVLSTGATMHANGPVQAMKWGHTDSYYQYCVKAKSLA
jgi:hypothetical protein